MAALIIDGAHWTPSIRAADNVISFRDGCIAGRRMISIHARAFAGAVNPASYGRRSIFSAGPGCFDLNCQGNQTDAQPAPGRMTSSARYASFTL